MLPGPRLLLPALLLLGTARCSSPWTPGPPDLTRSLPADSAPHSPSTPGDAHTGRIGLILDYYRPRASGLSPARPEETQNRPRTTNDVASSQTEPNRTGTQSEPNRTNIKSEPTRTEPTSEPNRTNTQSEPTRTYSTSEPTRTNTESEPTRTDTPSVPKETETLSEPNRTVPPSEPNRTHNASLFGHLGISQMLKKPDHTEQHWEPHMYYKSEPDWMHMDPSQTSAAAGISQKPPTQRHLNKRTPHVDTTYSSSTQGGDQNVSSVTKDITESPNTYPTDSGSSSGASRDITEDWVDRNATVQSDPLQTPSYLVTTYPSPTSANATLPLTSVPVTVPNTRSSPKTTGVTPNNSNTSLWSSSPSDVASSSSVSMSTVTPFTPQSQQPPSQVSSSSPVPPTIPPSLTTQNLDPQTALSATPGSPSPYTSLFPSTDSTPRTETIKTLTSSISPTDNTSIAVSPETPRVVTDETTTQDVTTALKPMETETPEMSTARERTESTLVGTRFIQTPAPTIDNAPSTTSPITLLTTPSQSTTQEMSRDIVKTTTVAETTHRDLTTEEPKTTVSRKPLPYPTPAGTTPAVKRITTAMTAPTTTHLRIAPTTAASPCASSPCHNGGQCVESGDTRSYSCDCPPAWSGHLCTKDVDECLSSPCPALSTCINARGSYSCQCPLGHLLQKGAGCVPVRTFLGHIEIPWSLLDGADVKDSTLRQIKDDIVRILNSSFSTISGYYQSTVSSDSHISGNSLIIQNLFSLESNVTMYDLQRSLQSYARVCETSPDRPTSCALALHLQHRVQALSLCHVKSPGCDNETSVCTDPAGLAFCQCKAGYFKFSKTDLSCRACDDGYKLENGVCVRCPFGLGGFNCSNPYQLITVIIAAGGGGLLLILVVALTVTCCRKSKHDISKLIFKSGDFQMSPYAEYPKTQRSSDWGRETIEMQENGSTKNLLQMTDVYYSPGLRNAEMERNGLYPYTGLPGSRHSCIYPGQYNPSFINEENRRRDYF